MGTNGTDRGTAAIVSGAGRGGARENMEHSRRAGPESVDIREVIHRCREPRQDKGSRHFVYLRTVEAGGGSESESCFVWMTIQDGIRRPLPVRLHNITIYESISQSLQTFAKCLTIESRFRQSK